ncbi:MAG: 3-deoxy-manno-octulosonate cytidylyltransferase [Bacteroidales bacterium]|nr:3-deoxy-manno-octulosonate cytidylyltransferase [Bacteroidales bacterium]
MKTVGIIPARYASTRFPGKPLVLINDKPMIQHVYEQACKSRLLSKVVVATDHEAIFAAVRSFGGEVVLTSPHHQSGTDRCFEAFQKLSGDYGSVINIQGDEPFIDPEQIDSLASLLQSAKANIATLARRIDNLDDLLNPNIVKVVMDSHSKALYFSRYPIPFQRNMDKDHWLAQTAYYKHLGIYGYDVATLAMISRYGQTMLETAESLEQLRWLENGHAIHVALTEKEGHSIDTPDDLKKLMNKS